MYDFKTRGATIVDRRKKVLKKIGVVHGKAAWHHNSLLGLSLASL